MKNSLIDPIPVETNPPLSPDPRVVARGSPAGTPSPAPQGPPLSAQTPLSSRPPSLLLIPRSRTAGPQARAVAVRGGAGRGRVARQAAPHPVSEPAGLRSPYLRGQPVAAQRRTPVGAQPGTRLRALGTGPPPCRTRGADRARRRFGGRGALACGSARALCLPSCVARPRGPLVPSPLAPDRCAGEATGDSFPSRARGRTHRRAGRGGPQVLAPLTGAA